MKLTTYAPDRHLPDEPVKLCRFVKPVPLVLTLNTVPWPELPPCSVVPYRVLPDKINLARGPAPSLLIYGKVLVVTVKLCRVVKACADTRPAGIKPRPAISAGRRNRLEMYVFIDVLIFGSSRCRVGDFRGQNSIGAPVYGVERSF